MNAHPYTREDLRAKAARGDRMAATVLMLWEELEPDADLVRALREAHYSEYYEAWKREREREVEQGKAPWDQPSQAEE